MKKVIGIMIAFAVVMLFGSGIISTGITALIGGGTAESYIYPIYGGIILLSGLIVGCTCVILEKLEEIEKKMTSEKQTMSCSEPNDT